MKRILENAFLDTDEGGKQGELVCKGSETKRLLFSGTHLPPVTFPISPHPALASSRVANYPPAAFTLKQRAIA